MSQSAIRPITAQSPESSVAQMTQHTLGEACRTLQISRKTLDKWLARLKIEPTRHAWDFRYYVIGDEDVAKIADARSQMPALARMAQPRQPARRISDLSHMPDPSESPRSASGDPLPPATPRRPDASATRPLSALRVGTSRQGADGSKAEVCRWLADGHGVLLNTARHWSSHDGMPTEKRSAFAWALAKEREAGWRKGATHIPHCARPRGQCRRVPTD